MITLKFVLGSVGHSFLLVWVSASQRIPLSVLARNLHARFPTRSEEDEERQSPRAVNRSRGTVMVRERRLPSEELGPVDSEAGSTSARG